MIKTHSTKTDNNTKNNINNTDPNTNTDSVYDDCKLYYMY